MMSDIKERLRAYILQNFLQGESPANLKDDVPLRTTGVLDSLATLNLVSFVEKEFGIELTARRRQHANAFGRDIDTFAGHELCLRIADGVRNDGDRQARVSEPACNYTRERCERDAANRCGWNAEVFECGRVTRGPGGG